MSLQYSPEDIEKITNKIKVLLETRNSHNISFAWQLLHNMKLNNFFWKNIWDLPLTTHSNEHRISIRGSWDKRFRQIFYRFISKCPPFERNEVVERVRNHLAIMYVIEHKSILEDEYPPFFILKMKQDYFSIYASCMISTSEKEYLEKTFKSSRSHKFFQSNFFKFVFKEHSKGYHFFALKAIISKKNNLQKAKNNS